MTIDQTKSAAVGDKIRRRVGKVLKELLSEAVQKTYGVASTHEENISSTRQVDREQDSAPWLKLIDANVGIHFQPKALRLSRV